VLAPDAGWVSNERLQALPEEARLGFARIAPDVAFELLSPSDTLRSLRAKASQYLANGVRLVVLLDPRSRLVECHRPDIALEAHLSADIVLLEPEMPGFQLDAGAIFKAMM
jgi:Uma2 family endonuclease